MFSKSTYISAVVLGFVTFGVYVVAAEHNCVAKGSSAKLDVFKQLAGDWVNVGENGKATDQVISTYRVTAGGSAVLETIFPGSDHEMVTVYHEDGENVVLTHYCVLGNQPRMRVEFTDDPNRLLYKCTGGTNIKSESDEHMHEGGLTILGKDRIKVEWLKFKDGENDYTAAFELIRNGRGGA